MKMSTTSDQAIDIIDFVQQFLHGPQFVQHYIIFCQSFLPGIIIKFMKMSTTSDQAINIIDFVQQFLHGPQFVQH